MDTLEVDLEDALKLADSGSEVKVLMDNFGDLEFVKGVFNDKNKIEETDFNEARVIVMNLGDAKDIRDVAKKFENCVIICPHGNTSLRMAVALHHLGVKAYSLQGGIAGLRNR